MLRLAGCPKCKSGDTAFDRDYYGWYEYCIQCGYTRDLISTTEVGQQQTCGTKEGKKMIRTLARGK